MIIKESLLPLYFGSQKSTAKPQPSSSITDALLTFMVKISALPLLILLPPLYFPLFYWFWRPVLNYFAKRWDIAKWNEKIQWLLEAGRVCGRRKLQEDMRELWGVMEFLHLDCSRGYQVPAFVKIHWTEMLKMVHFIVSKLNLNKVDLFIQPILCFYYLQAECTQVCRLFTEQGYLVKGPGGAECQPMPGSLSQVPSTGLRLLRRSGRLLWFGKGFICIWFSGSLVLKI